MGRRRLVTIFALATASVTLLAATPVGTTRTAPTLFEASSHDRECSSSTGTVPTEARADLLTGPTLTLRIHVLLDLPREVRWAAQQLITAAAGTTYADGAGIDAELSFSVTDVPGQDQLDTRDAIEIAKARTGGRPPGATDLVYLVTDNDLTALGVPWVAGMADCVGGISNPEQAYAVGEFDPDDLDRGGLFGTDVPYFRNMTGKIFAHEVGHLVGAHHHYANCVEGVPSDPLGDVLSACTLMFNDVGLASLNLSQVNVAVARGYVARWGNAN